MEKKNEKTNNPSTSLLVGNLVDGFVDNEVDINDPIINYLVKNEGWNEEDSDNGSIGSGSDDSDIEYLIEEHILIEKLKQVTGQKGEEGVRSDHCEGKVDFEDPITSAAGNCNVSELKLLKKQIEEAIQLNLKMREELLVMEKRLDEKYREFHKKKQEKVEERKMAGSKAKLLASGPIERFLDSFRAPYFKFDGSVAPWNADYKKLLSTNIPILSENEDWNSASIASLCIAIRKFLIYEKTKAMDDGRQNKMRDLISCSRSECLRMKNGPLYDLVKDRDDASIDWKTIASYLSKPVTEKDCLQMWSLHVKPALREWSNEEHQNMLQIAKSHRLQNWDIIARELNSGRSGYECFFQHQSSFVLEWNDGKWSKEEEEQLNRVIENSKIGNFTSWDKVAYFMDSKYAEQIYAKWHCFQAPHILRGAFSEHEDRILLGMIHKFGADLKTVSAVLKNRSVAQLSARYKDHLLPQLRLKVGEWTVEEDEKLLKLVEEHGESNWAVIARYFKTRSRIQIRHRHKTLKTKLTKDPNLNLRMINRPRRPTSKKRINKNKFFYSKVISTTGKTVKNIMQSDNTKLIKRVKPIDMKLTQYYQTKLLTEKVDDTKFSNISRQINENKTATSTTYLTNDQDNDLDCSPFKVKPGESLISSLIFSSLALKNLQETAETDEWSDKDRVAFNKGILELYTNKEETQKDLFQWHRVFCSLFAAPALLSHLDFDKWEHVISKVLNFRSD